MSSINNSGCEELNLEGDTETEHVYEGWIKTVIHAKCFGFVQASEPRLPDRYTRTDVYFKWFEEKASDFEGIQQGLRVHFKLDQKSQNDKPSLKELCVIDGDFARELPVANFGKRRNHSSSRMRSATPSGSRTRTRSRSLSKARRASQSLVATEIDIDNPPESTSGTNEGGPNDASASSNANTRDGKRTTKPTVRAKNRLTGIVVDVKEREGDGSFGFIEPDTDLPVGYTCEGDIRFFVKNVKPSGIVPKRGDEVAFVLGSRDMSKAFAIRVYIESYADTRSESEIEGVLRGMYEKVLVLSENQTSDGLIELLSGLEVWRCVTDYRSLSSNGIEILIKLLFSLKAVSQGLQGNFKTVLRAILETHLFSPTNGSLVQYIQLLVSANDQEGLSNIRRFLLMLVEFVPEKMNIISSTIKPMVSNDKNSVEFFVYHVLKKAVSHSDSDSQCEDKEWKDLSLAPSSQEILHGPLEGAFNLRPVLEKGPYASAEEYLDTYFRLFRADCFSALNKGVRDLLKGKLDHRDMNAYHSIELFGIDLSTQDMPLTIAIKLTPFRPVRKWDKSRNLMFGNLVCISVTGNFRDAIWATVISRDLLQQNSVVMLELCSECNSVEDSKAIQYLENADKRSVLVESPTYYRAYQPILKNLQRMDPETIPFQNEIVRTQKVVPSPNFMTSDTTLQGNLLYQDRDRMLIDEFFCAEGLTTFDKSQEQAFKHCLFRQLAIIQGPPGTGKTFIGVRLVRALNSLSTKPDTPILLLTYKNHALDEFLKQLAEVYPDKVARIGGRQQDAEMARFNLSNLKRETKKSKDLFSQLMDHREEMDSIGKSLANDFEASCQRKSFSFEMFLANAAPQQLENLLLSCPWNRTSIPSVLASSGFRPGDDFTTVTGRRRGHKGPSVDRPEVVELLRIIKSQTDNVKDFYSSSQEVPELIRLQTGFQLLVFEAFKMWLPHSDIFTLIKDTLNHSAAVDFSKFGVKDSDKKKSDKDDKDDDSDEEAKEEEEERKAATDSLKGAKTKLENIIKVQRQTGGGWRPESFPIPKEYLADLFVSQLLNQEDLWELSDRERVLYVQIMMHTQFQESSSQFSEDLAKYKAAHQCKNELENLHSLSILRQKKFVGMTITGASIHCDLIAQLRPAIVVVEEAAEVMEPQLLSCLGPWVRQLILIGDHKQLRANVESFELRKNYHLDISLMERLINNGLEFSTLLLQNRMRPEFAEMLKDIYPHLESNMRRVLKNQVPPSAVESMYFWCHRFQECGPNSKVVGKSTEGNIGRSYTNEEEADRCINLALFFIQQGHALTEITILGAYLGQVKLLRKKMGQAQNKYPNLFPEKVDSDREQIQREGVAIQTIDNFQGDENTIVLVSLVRSNGENNIGFLNTLNRRCVAQSRAKCGMYFIGNEITIGSSRHWRPVLESMREANAVGPRIPLQCKHHSTTRVNPASAVEVPLTSFCAEKCNILNVCRIHRCKKPCQPFHDHNRCFETVHFMFTKCGHPGTRKCHEDEAAKVCPEKVMFRYTNCEHLGEKNCWDDAKSKICNTVVTFQHPCTHYDTRECHVDPKTLTCKKMVMFKFPCKHTGRKKCYENEKDMKCSADVFVLLQCGHHATKKCEEDESKITCNEKVNFVFTKCKHPRQKLCHQSENDVRCISICLKPYTGCGHFCVDLCSQPCVEDRCKECARIRKAIADKAKEDERKRLEAIRENVDAEIASIMSQPAKAEARRTLSRDGEDAVEYLDVYDKVMRYIQPMHVWRPEITKIEKITNVTLLLKYLQYKKKMFNPSIAQDKFHGTNAIATDAICKSGFIMPKPDKQMYGPGIYFATDSSKSAQEIYTKGSGMLLLCEVLLGKSLIANKARRDMTADKLKFLGYDSVTAPRGTAVKNDEFIVYNPDQALPKFIVHYKKDDVAVRVIGPLGATPGGSTLQKHTITPKRTSSLDDPLEMHFRIVESQFLRLKNKYASRTIPEIKSIDYYVNPLLVAKYTSKKDFFEKKYGTNRQESEEVLAFHGTESRNIQSIVTTNFDMKMIKRAAHGMGIYFSEFPEVSEHYGNALLLCRVLPGKSHIETTHLPSIPPGSDSIAVKPDAHGRAQMLVIADSDQILPCYVVNT